MFTLFPPHPNRDTFFTSFRTSGPRIPSSLLLTRPLTYTVGFCAVFPGHHTADVKCVAVSPDGKWAVSGGDDKKLCLWNLETATLVAGFHGLSHMPALPCTY